MKKFMCVLMYITLTIGIILSVVDFWCFNKTFYYSEQDKYSINTVIGVSKDDMKVLTDVTLDYLKDRNKTLDLQLEVRGRLREVYNDKEKSHMVDVRELYLSAMKVKDICFVIAITIFAFTLIDKVKIKEYYDVFKKTLIGIGIFFLTIGSYVFINFDEFWYNFHLIFFPNNTNWLLDPVKDILIMFVPGEFFDDLVVNIIIMSVCLIALLFIILFIVNKKKKNEN